MTHDRMAVLNTIADQGLMSLYHHHDTSIAFQVVERIAQGGGRVVEFTNRFPQAIFTFAELVSMVRDRYPDVILGVGSVEDPTTAGLFINAGAEFVVSPGLGADTAYMCNRHKIPYLPGTMTITEIAEAERLGCEYVKLYPATNPAFVPAVHGPRPWTRIVANGPIGPSEVAPWFEAGVTAIGTGAMTSPAFVAEGQFHRITETVKTILERISEVRKTMVEGPASGAGKKEN